MEGTRSRCPICETSHSSAGAALRCWSSHDPDLSVTHTLQEMGDRLGVTRERVRQVLLRMGEQRRAGRSPTTRPLGGSREQDPRRKAYRKRRHQERLATDPAYRERLRAKSRRQYARRKGRE